MLLLFSSLLQEEDPTKGKTLCFYQNTKMSKMLIRTTYFTALEIPLPTFCVIHI